MRAFKSPTERELRRELEHTPGLRALRVARAETAKHHAENMAPEGTGDYKDSLDVTVLGDQVFLVTRDPFGHLVEFGSVNNPPYAPLRRGARAAGLSLREMGHA